MTAAICPADLALPQHEFELRCEGWSHTASGFQQGLCEHPARFALILHRDCGTELLCETCWAVVSSKSKDPDLEWLCTHCGEWANSLDDIVIRVEKLGK